MDRAAAGPAAWRSAIAAIAAMWIAAAPIGAHAQVVLDGTLHPGQSGVPVPAGTDATGRPATYLIGEEQGTRAGSNVFHSFSRFDVPVGETATFDRAHAGDPTAVHHVVARVTGADASEISGTLRSTYSGADLLLVNPAGVSFGDKARIDVPGSLRVSTADYVKLGSDGRFDAADPSRDVLSMAPPSAFGFLGAPAAVSVASGAHAVVGARDEPGRLSIVAGDVNIAGSLSSQRGGIDIVSVRSAGEADLAHLDASADHFSAMGDVRVTGALSESPASVPAEVMIRAGRFEVDGGAVVDRVFSGEAETGRIDVAADDVVLANGGHLDAQNFASGGTPRIEVDTARLSIVGSLGDQGSRIDGSAAASGRGSDIHIRASESVAIHPGVESGGILADANYADDVAGDGGSITIDTPLLTLGELGRISAGTDGAGAAGRIDLHVGDLDATGGAQIRTDVGPSGRGRAGDITVAATGTVRFAERVALFPGPPYERASGISANTGSDAGGAQVRVSASRLVLDDAEIHTGTGSRGDSADVNIDVGTLEIRNGGRIFTGTDGPGRGGDITVHASEGILIAGHSGPLSPTSAMIQASTTGPGGAGNISIATPLLHLAETGRISAFTAENPGNDPDGGVVHASDIPGAGGQILLTVGDLVLEDDGLVEARTSWAGRAGSISVHASGSVSIRDSKPMLGIDPRDAGLQTRTFSSGDAGPIYVETPLLQITGGAIETSAVRVEDYFQPHTGNAGDVELHVSRLEISGWGRVRSAAEEGGDAGHVGVLASDSVSIQGDGAFGVVAGISTDTLKTGAGGTIDVAAPRIRVAGVGEVAARTSGSGRGGTIQLRGDDVEIGPGGVVTAASTGSGDAGDVFITGRSLLVDGGRVATSALAANGGNVVLTLDDRLHMRDGEITASVLQGVGGNITIDPELIFLESSRILAQAGAGRGGAIRLVATFIFATDSLVSASAGPAGVDGVVEIVSPDADLSAELELPPAVFLDAATLLRERCAARAGARASLYVVEAPAAAAHLDGWLVAPIAAEPEQPVTTAARPLVALSCSG